MVYKRGDTWWYRFRFRGIQFRESSKSTNKSLAERLEREHHRRLELSQQGLEEVNGYVTFSKASKDFIKSMSIHWAASTTRHHNNSLLSLLPFFGKMALVEIKGIHVNGYQIKRRGQGIANGSINFELSLLRQVMRRHKLWANVSESEDYRTLKPNTNVGRELTDEECIKLLAACKACGSRMLYPAVLFSIYTGLRNHELRLLRWNQIDLLENPSVTVGKSKSEAGKGRVVPLSDGAWSLIKDWRTNYPHAKPTHYVFPSERYTLKGKFGQRGGVLHRYKLDPDKPISSFAPTWARVKRAAGVECRWHDLRHSCASRLAAGGATDQTLMALLGWMSRKMIERYSHVRMEAKRQAVKVFDNIPGIIN